MLDRSVAPVIRPIETIRFAPLKSLLLPGKVPLYYLDQGDQEVARIDLMLSAGKWNQNKTLVSTFTNLMLKEGAGKKTGKEIAEQLDYYGSWLQLADGFHYSYLTVYTLNRFFKETLDILLSMFREPAFGDESFETLRNRCKQQHLINEEKVQYLANKTFVRTLFGAGHPYGTTAEASDYDCVTTDDLKQFHHSYYRFDNLKVVLSGKISDEMIAYCESVCPKLSQPGGAGAEVERVRNQENHAERRVFVEKEGVMQNALRLGLSVVNRNHPDFPGLRVLNTLLGGYFGSRLMSNIREEKGYTYGISSGITTLKHAAYLSVATQTACEHTEPLIKEVYREIERLQTETVPDQELEMVRNYMLGDFARSLDGVFSLVDAYISLLATEMEPEFLLRQVEAVKNCRPEEIKRLAQRYLTKDQFIEAVAGKMS